LAGLRLIAYFFVGSLIAGWLLVGVVRRAVVRRGLLDLPNARSSHATPTARGGGIAIVLVTLVTVAIDFSLHGIPGSLSVAWILGGSLVAGVGFVDDLKGLSALVRAGIHLLAAILLLNAVDFPAVLASLGLTTAWLGFFWVVLGVVIVWSINLFNFMDGIDALASAQCLFVVLAGAVLVGTAHGNDSSLLPCVAMAGASAGFLIWNAPPAKIFMGDVGSGFIGFGLIAGALATSGHGPVSLWTWLVLNGLFVVDSTVTVLTRLFRGQRIYQAHRSHAYQRLARRWSSHGWVTAAYMSINLIWCLPWAVATTKSPGNAPVVALAALLPLCVAAIAAGAGKPDA
jgi:Fuc2NAc and GlcNAc transferase